MGPLAEGKDGIFANPILVEIGEKYDKSAAQVILRWLLQRGIIVFPKSTKESRMIENSDYLTLNYPKRIWKKSKNWKLMFQLLK